MASPWFGVGMGGVDNVLNNPLVDPLSVLVGATESSNEYLRLFVAIGIVGAVLAVVALLALVIPAIKTAWHLPATSPLAPLVAALVAMMINEIFEDGLFAFGDSSAILFWFIFFMVAFAVHQSQRSVSPGPGGQAVAAPGPRRLATGGPMRTTAN
jgi:O-antigen ligase